MTDLDRIAAWVALEVADKGPLMNNPNHWGAGGWERLWKHVRETASNKPRSKHRQNLRAAEHVMRHGDLPPPSFISPRDIVIGPAGDYPDYYRPPRSTGAFT